MPGIDVRPSHDSGLAGLKLKFNYFTKGGFGMAVTIDNQFVLNQYDARSVADSLTGHSIISSPALKKKEEELATTEGQLGSTVNREKARKILYTKELLLQYTKLKEAISDFEMDLDTEKKLDILDKEMEQKGAKYTYPALSVMPELTTLFAKYGLVEKTWEKNAGN